jgi:hypothetical protein
LGQSPNEKQDQEGNEAQTYRQHQAEAVSGKLGGFYRPELRPVRVREGHPLLGLFGLL